MTELQVDASAVNAVGAQLTKFCGVLDGDRLQARSCGDGVVDESVAGFVARYDDLLAAISLSWYALGRSAATAAAIYRDTEDAIATQIAAGSMTAATA